MEKDVNPVLFGSPLEVAEFLVADLPSLREIPGVLGCLTALRAQRPLDAFRLLPDPIEFVGDADKFASYRQFLAIVTKAPYRGWDTKSAARQSWYAQEAKNKTTNAKWRARARFPLEAARHSPVMEECLNYDASYIRRILGRLTPSKYRQILDLSRPGPGISIGTRNRLLTSPVAKFLDTDHVCTPASLGVVRDWFLRNPKLLSTLQSIDGKLGVECRLSNRVTFVPKNAKTDRGIAIEPSLNVMFQLGLHEYFIRLFSHKGVAHLNDQRPNQFLAGLGSGPSGIFGLATLDLSAASDSITTGLVRRLIPDDWLHLLDSLRCPNSVIDGVEVPLEKYSSMGNGFTFALETLIFKALAEAARDYGRGCITSVYGDDIIIDSSCALLLTDLLDYCGLSVNTDKSFVVGSFKESCGADWLNGKLITPVYVRDLKVRLDTVHRLWNGLRGTNYTRFRARLMSRVRATTTPLFGPECATNESCFKLSRRQLSTVQTARWVNGLGTWKYRCLITDSVEFPRSHPLAYASALLSGAFSLAKRGRKSVRVGWRLAH